LTQRVDVIAVVVGEQDVGDVQAVLVGLLEQRSERAARVDQEGVAVRPGGDEIGVGQPAITHGTLDDHGPDGTLAASWNSSIPVTGSVRSTAPSPSTRRSASRSVAGCRSAKRRSTCSWACPATATGSS